MVARAALIAGATAPATIAGAIVQQNAEALAGIAFTQMVRRGAPVIIDADALHSKSKNSPFDGRRLQGKLIGTWVGGRKVF